MERSGIVGTLKVHMIGPTDLFTSAALEHCGSWGGVGWNRDR